MFLRLFRAPDLAFWALAVLVLGGLVLGAMHLGADPERAATAPGANAVASATTSTTRTHARDLEALMQAGTAAGTDPAALTAWAGAVSQIATEGASVRASEGAPDGDDLRTEFATIAQTAGSLTAQAGEPVVATALRTQIGLRVSRVNALVQGLPAPALPAGSTDLFGVTGAEPADPSPAPPTTPGLPTLPQSPAVPTLPTTPVGAP